MLVRQFRDVLKVRGAAFGRLRGYAEIGIRAPRTVFPQMYYDPAQLFSGYETVGGVIPLIGIVAGRLPTLATSTATNHPATSI